MAQWKIALAGNPNCGKTTLFNALTGANQYVGNWPGVTVEKKDGKLKDNKDVIIQDLPGIYSLSPYTLEEVVARNYLVNENGTNIERNLYLTTQLLELGIPVVIAVNMIDLVRKNGDRIDLDKLGEALGCKAVEMSALKGDGCDAAAKAAVAAAQAGRTAKLPKVFTGCVEQAIETIEGLIRGKVENRFVRWYAVKLFERDEKVVAEVKLDAAAAAQIEQAVAACEQELDDDAESIVTNQRYTFLHTVVPIFALVMLGVYTIAMGSTPVSFGTMGTDWVNDVLFTEIVPPAVEGFLVSIGCADWLVGLINDGIVAGVGAALGFVPQILVLSFLLAILEDIGYMARIAFVMDRIFRRFGLSGKSFIPLLVASGCGIPGVMASRTIEQDRDRKLTIMTTCFIPCSAKMPIIGLLAGAIFGGSSLVAVSAYFIGIAAVVVSGIILKKTRAFAGDPAPFVMELPAYHVPAWGNVLRSTWERGASYVKRAGTVILTSTVVLWFLQGYGFTDGAFGAVEDANTSLLAVIAGAVAPIFAPLGFGNWRATTACVGGLIAKENVVSTLAVTFGVGEVAENGEEIWGLIAANFTALSAYSFMIYDLQPAVRPLLCRHGRHQA